MWLATIKVNTIPFIQHVDVFAELNCHFALRHMQKLGTGMGMKDGPLGRFRSWKYGKVSLQTFLLCRKGQALKKV